MLGSSDSVSHDGSLSQWIYECDAVMVEYSHCLKEMNRSSTWCVCVSLCVSV